MLLRRAGVTKLNRPRVLICVPSAITSVERRAVKEAARRAGASAAYLIEQPMAAAIGAGLRHPRAGGQHGGRRRRRHDRDGGHLAGRRGGLAGHPLRRVRHRRRHPGLRAAEYGIAIGERTAEEIKLAIGSAFAYDDEQKAEVRGREVTTGLPKTVVLSPDEVRDALEDQVASVIEAAANCLARGAARAGPGHHLRGHPPGRRRRPAAGLGPAAGRRDRGAGPPGRHAARVRGPRGGHVPRVVRQAAPALRRGRLTSTAPARRSRRTGLVEQVLGHLADLPVAVVAAAPRGRPRPRDRRRRPGPPRPGGGRPACRRARRGRPGSPAGSPMAPRAATAASRQRVSSWVAAVPARAATAGRWRRSPRNQAAPTTTSGSGSARASVRAAGRHRARPLAPRRRARRRRHAGAPRGRPGPGPARRRTPRGGRGAARRPGRPPAPRGRGRPGRVGRRPRRRGDRPRRHGAGAAGRPGLRS